LSLNSIFEKPFTTVSNGNTQELYPMGLEFVRPNSTVLLVGKRTESEQLKSLFIELGFSQVTLVGSSAEALEVIYAEYPDLLVTEKEIDGRLDGIHLASLVAQKHIKSVLLVDRYDEIEGRAEVIGDTVHLLQKPVDSLKLKETLQQLMSHDYGGTGKNLTIRDQFFIRVNNRLQCIKVSAIEWIESEGNYCVFHYSDKRFALKISLRKVIAELEDYPLVQIHKKYVVHLGKIDTIDISDGQVCLENQTLPIGRRYRQEFLDRLHWIK